MNKFDSYITDYLYENREVALEKIGYIKIISFAGPDSRQASVDYIFDKKITTSTGLVEYISEKTGKNKSLVIADLESHLKGVREFINIGKPYEIPQIGFIKANNSGVYEFTPVSEINTKPVKTATQPLAQTSAKSSRTVVQIISLIIAIAILSGLGWQAYQALSKKTKEADMNTVASADTVSAADTGKTTDTTAQQPTGYSPDDSVNVRYIFEVTASGLRARTRTAQLKGFGNNALYDSFVNNSTKRYDLYILQKTKIADTLRIKDSLAKFFMRDITLKIEQ
ncbi:hypothetical protein [Parafilimonas terrae]|uniref:CCDC81-like prokaryotic HU domain-containing protein n=1 Tax=Parafilimonas terrae TaxID=1465490 RepID=A0A1I5YQT7_9BACT|nr:hypothetical protein [Parafilimonas terrae]SFQ46654.1 hypothetical protein SAMN05444277_113135 [Parafilimonas terrae]